MLQLERPAFPVYVCTSVCTQLPCREINGLEAERRGEWRSRGGRQPEGDVKLIPVLQFWSYLEKKLVHVFVLEVHMCGEEWFKPSTAGDLPFLQTHIGTMEQSWCEPNGYRHKQLESQTKPASNTPVNLLCLVVVRTSYSCMNWAGVWFIFDQNQFVSDGFVTLLHKKRLGI